MSPKVSLLFIFILLLPLLQPSAARPVRDSSNSSPVVTDHAQMNHNFDETEQPNEAWETDCGGDGEDDCLMRRTLTAHLDYIYTQKNNHP